LSLIKWRHAARHNVIDALQRDDGGRPTTTIDEELPRLVAWYRDDYGKWLARTGAESWRPR
jgi:hypothetical protein